MTGLAVILSCSILNDFQDFLLTFSIALYHKWDITNVCLCAPIFLTCLWRSRWCEVLDFGSSHEENAAEVNLDAAYETRDLVKGPAEP